MSDSTGWIVLIGMFVAAAFFAFWNARLRRSAQQRLATLGFAPCPGEEAALASAWRDLCAAVGSERTVRIEGCLRKPAGWGMVHAFDVHDETHDGSSQSGRAHVGASWPAYLLDLREPAALHSAPVALYFAKSESRIWREILRNLTGLSETGAQLERGGHPWSAQIFAAFGRTPGKLDEIVPPAVQQELARAAEHGFLSVHLANGKAAFSVLPARRDVDREWTFLSRWC